MMKVGWTGLWLRPVNCDWTGLVAAPGDLDLSGVTRTLGGSIRSLPPERPVSRSRVGLELHFVFFPYPSRGPPYIRI